MGRFRIQLLTDGQWETKNTIDKKTNLNASSTEWIFLN